MYIHPLPTPLRVGTDIIHVARITRLLSRYIPQTEASKSGATTKLPDHTARYERFLQRLLTPRERKAFGDLQTGSSGTEERDAGSLDSREQSWDKHERWLAGRWAAKEALIKATKPRRLLLRDIEIWSDAHGEHFGLVSTSPTTASHLSQSHNAFTSADYSPERFKLLKYPKPSEIQFSEDGSVVSGLEECFEITENVGNSTTTDGITDRTTETAKQLARVSISHDGEYAVAVALATSMPAIKPG